MTPEQEILEDSLAAALQRAATFEDELKQHARTFPLDPARDWRSPSDDLQTEMAAFTKRYEMTHDIVTRRLFRSILAVRGTALRTNALVHVVGEMHSLGIVDDLPLWDQLTKLRNSFAHDYAMRFADIVPMLNQAWTFAPILVEMIGRVDRYVVANNLLATVRCDD